MNDDETTEPTEQAPTLDDLKLPPSSVAEILRLKVSRAEAKWSKTPYNLDKIRPDNYDLYTSEYLHKMPRDLDAGEPFLDNRLFVAVRTLTPFLINRLSTPEVTPAKGTDLAATFAKDFERVMQKLAKKQNAKEKVRLAIQDLLMGQRKGVLKFKWDDKAKKIRIIHCKPDSILIDADTDQYTEPQMFRERVRMTVRDAFDTFPEQLKAMKTAWSITNETPAVMEQVKELYEYSVFLTDVNGDSKLAIVHMYQDVVLGAMVDPLYDETEENNIIEEPMHSYVVFNFLTDGTGHEDDTSFIEQAKYSQKNYDKQGQTIIDDFQFGGSGVPVVAKGAIEDDDLAELRFAPNQRLSLDTEDVTKAFMTWSKPHLDNAIIEDKQAHQDNIKNTFGAPDIFSGQDSSAKTLGENVIIRDQAEGRAQDQIDQIDAGMRRFWLLYAQFMCRYMTEDQMYKFVDNGEFAEVVMSSAKIRENAGLEIDVEEGSSLPIDRSQKRAVLMKLLEMNKVGTLQAYKELGPFDDPEKAFKQYLQEQTDPAALLADVDKSVFDRKAEEDLQAVIGGEVPDEREDVDQEYLLHLQEWQTTNKYDQLKPAQQAAVNAFIEMVANKAELKAAKLQSLIPLPPQGGAPGAPAIGPDGQPLPPGPPGAGPTPPDPAQLASMQPQGPPGITPDGATPPQQQPAAPGLPEVPPAVPAGVA